MSLAQAAMALNAKPKRLCFNPVDNREWAEADDQIRMMTYGNAGGYFGNGGGSHWSQGRQILSQGRGSDSDETPN